MLFDYKMNKNIGCSDVDVNDRFGTYQVVKFAQDIFTKYFKSFGSDNPTLKSENNAAWVLSKTKIRFISAPGFNEQVKSRIYTTVVKPVRMVCETVVNSENGDNLLIINQEYCAIDIDSRKPKKLKDIKYPKDMECEKAIIKDPFIRFKSEFGEDDFVYETKMFSQDIDSNLHVNNTVYVRLILNCFNIDFLRRNHTKEFEIHYTSEALEGEFLSIYKKKRDYGFDFLISSHDREVAKAYIEFE